jgi:hypothetical protein
MSLWCAQAIVGDPPSLRRSHEIYSTYDCRGEAREV